MEYKIHEQPIFEKYKHRVVKFYMARLEAQLEGRAFTQAPPSKDWTERFNKAQSTVSKISKKAEMKISQVEQSLNKKIEEKGWKDKMKGFFAKKGVKA